MASEPFQGWVSRAILQQYGDGLQPRLIVAESFAKVRRADTHILTAHLLAEKTAEGGDAFGAISCPNILHILTERLGAAGALAMAKVICADTP